MDSLKSTISFFLALGIVTMIAVICNGLILSLFMYSVIHYFLVWKMGLLKLSNQPIILIGLIPFVNIIAALTSLMCFIYHYGLGGDTDGNKNRE